MEQKIGFIGAGKMAMALAKGFISANLIQPSQVLFNFSVISSEIPNLALVFYILVLMTLKVCFCRY
jgi:hypothetical protein